MIKTFEKFSDQSYLKNYKKYVLLYTEESELEYIIVENFKNQIKKIYHSYPNQNLSRYATPFYFSLSQRNFDKWYVYDSDTLSDIFNKFELLKTSKKYNL